MKLHEGVYLPLFKLYHFDKQRSCIHDGRHAEYELETYDSADPDYAAEVTVLDALLRRVSIVIDGLLVLRKLELLNNAPLQEDIDLFCAYRYVPPRSGWPVKGKKRRVGLDKFD